MPGLTHDSDHEELSTAEISTAESIKFDDEILNSMGDTANIDNNFKKAFGISLNIWPRSSARWPVPRTTAWRTTPSSTPQLLRLRPRSHLK